MRPYVICATILLAFSTLGGELGISGFIGQSQPAGAEPLPSPGMRGIAFDAEGRLHSFSEDGRLRVFSRTALSWTLCRTLKPPVQLVSASFKNAESISILAAPTAASIPMRPAPEFSRRPFRFQKEPAPFK